MYIEASRHPERGLRCMYDELLDLLLALEGVRQNPKYHPEGDALFHSLQVFEHAFQETEDWELLAAALLHDVGKAVDTRHHAEIGAELLADLMPERVTWLVTHHLDLLREPARTKHLLHGTPMLTDLERLRRWDLAGRDPDAWVPEPETALGFLMNAIAMARRGDEAPASARERR